tara:strand:- start:22590 stop:22790 length:201 start_codon:yes stop_codon:yes gene_type:complete
MKKQHLYLILTLVGLVLLFLGFNESNSTANQIARGVTGSFSDKVLVLYISGFVCFVIGGLGLKKKI